METGKLNIRMELCMEETEHGSIRITIVKNRVAQTVTTEIFTSLPDARKLAMLLFDRYFPKFSIDD